MSHTRDVPPEATEWQTNGVRLGLFYITLGVGYVGLALAHTYPLGWHLTSHLAGLGLGDNASFLWNVWWMREALSSPQYEWSHSPFLLAPFGASLVLHTHTALTAV